MTIASSFCMMPCPPSASRRGSESTRRSELCRVVYETALHHLPDALRVADVLERVSIEEHDVGELAWRQCAEIRASADLIGGALCRHAEDVDRREPGIGELGDLPVQRQAEEHAAHQ